MTEDFTFKADDKDEEKKPGVDPLTASLLKSRTVLVFGEVDDKLAKNVIAQLLALSAENDDPIKVLVSSPGGHVESGDAIHDMIRFVKPEVKTIGTGWVASAGVNIFLAAEKKNRFCTPNTRYMIHQPMGGARGRAADIEIEAKEILKARERINQLIAAETGQDIEKVRIDTDRNFWMSPEEAIAYGIVSQTVTSINEID